VKAYYLSKDEFSSTITTRQSKTSNSCEDKTIPQWGFQLQPVLTHLLKFSKQLSA
jgi:hypothetical protein